MKGLLILTTNVPCRICHSYSLNATFANLNEFRLATCILKTRQSSSRMTWILCRIFPTQKEEKKEEIHLKNKTKNPQSLGTADAMDNIRVLEIGNKDHKTMSGLFLWPWESLKLAVHIVCDFCVLSSCFKLEQDILLFLWILECCRITVILSIRQGVLQTAENFL